MIKHKKWDLIIQRTIGIGGSKCMNDCIHFCIFEYAYITAVVREDRCVVIVVQNIKFNLFEKDVTMINVNSKWLIF